MQPTTEHRTGRWREAWATRPARSRHDRKVAGVAAALARRYAVDPVLLRVAFVAGAFYGPGIPLYLLGCALLPDADRPRGRAGTVLSSVLVVGAAVLAALLLFGSEGGWIPPLLVCLALLVALHLTRGNLAGAGSSADVGPAAVPTGDTAPTVPQAAPGADAGPALPPTPPAWDPLGAAPFAWDLPEPAPQAAPEPATRSSRLTPITLGVALLASGAVGAVVLALPGVLGVAAVPAAALAVVGVGLVVGAFRHAGRWLLPFAVLLAAATWLAAVVPWADLDGGVGTIVAAPRSVSAVAPEYRRGVGDVTLDLSGLDLRPPPGGPPPAVRTAARVGVGSVVVVVPPAADIVVRGHSGLGDVTVDSQSRDGRPATLTVADVGPDGPGGGRIELDARAAVGSVTVSRG